MTILKEYTFDNKPHIFKHNINNRYIIRIYIIGKSISLYCRDKKYNNKLIVNTNTIMHQPRYEEDYTSVYKLLVLHCGHDTIRVCAMVMYNEICIFSNRTQKRLEVK